MIIAIGIFLTGVHGTAAGAQLPVPSGGAFSGAFGAGFDV